MRKLTTYDEIENLCEAMIAQLQVMLSVSRRFAYKLVNDGYIKAVKIGNSLKIPKISVIEYVMDRNENSN